MRRNQSLIWRCFFTAIVSTFTLNFLLSGASNVGWGAMSNPGLVNFGSFASNYNVLHFPFFIMLGIVGGLLGAFFNTSSYYLTKLRMKYVTSKWSKALEVVFIAAFTVCLAFFLCAAALLVPRASR